MKSIVLADVTTFLPQSVKRSYVATGVPEIDSLVYVSLAVRRLQRRIAKEMSQKVADARILATLRARNTMASKRDLVKAERAAANRATRLDDLRLHLEAGMAMLGVAGKAIRAAEVRTALLNAMEDAIVEAGQPLTPEEVLETLTRKGQIPKGLDNPRQTVVMLLGNVTDRFARGKNGRYMVVIKG